jgi:hypothetical protein
VIEQVPGAAQVVVEQTEGQGYLNVRLDRSAMARFGIAITEVHRRRGAATARHRRDRWPGHFDDTYPACPASVVRGTRATPQ